MPNRSPARVLRVLPVSLALILLTLVALPGCWQRESEVHIPYSALKARVAGGEVAEVRLSSRRIEAVSTESARRAGAPELWSSVPVLADPDFVRLLESHGVTYAALIDGPSFPAGLVVTLLAAVGVALFAGWRWRQMNPARGTLKLGRSRVRDARGRSETRFEDVAGVDEAKEELEEIVEFLRQPARFAALGARIPKGVLLVGPPGTGKTLLARAVAGEAGVPFFPVSSSEFLEVFVGVGASRVRKIFQQARAQSPAIIFLDELDAIGKSRTGAQSGANDEREHTLNQLLVELDGFDSRDGLIVMGATNRAETLDPALLRPGRFDRQILVDRPDNLGREAILRVHARHLRLAEEVELSRVAQRTPGFSGADLENALNEAALLAARRGLTAVGMAEIDAAIDRVVAGLERKRRLVSDKERRLVAFHEAGHAIVAEFSPTADPVRKVTIVPRGAAALGYMQQLVEERLLLQEDELMDRLAVLLGGRAAEHVVFGQYSTGAANDLERATALARRMVCEFGMSAAIGPMSFASSDSRGAADDGGTISEDVTARIEAEVQTLLNRAFTRACEGLRERRAGLDAVAAALLEQGTLERDEIRQLLAA
jgi:cell division protease FtsH